MSGAGPNQPAPSVGFITWIDLTVPDAAATLDFYKQVVGWGVDEVAMEEGGEEYSDYSLIDARGNAAAGICWARGSNLGLPPIWIIYVPVGDLDESLSIAEEDGGSIVKVQRDEAGKATYAVVRDPVGSYIGLVPGNSSN